jgi:hypothetical protein
MPIASGWDGLNPRNLKCDTDGVLATYLPGHICLENTTQTPLVAGATFTGAWQDTLHYPSLVIGITADKDSADRGLVFQWSPDASTVVQDDQFSYAANTGKVYTFTPAGRYFRVTFTNGTADQGVFNVETIFKRTGVKGSSHRIGDTIVSEDDAELVKAAITGVDSSGLWRNVQTTSDGNLAIANLSDGLSIARGFVSGASYVSKFGQNEEVGTGAYEDVWDGGGVYTWPANGTAPITHLYSTDNADTQSIEVQGLDINGAAVTQTKTLTGTTVVALDTALWRVFRMKNVGTADVAGVVHASTATKTVSYAQIKDGNNQTLMALYTIPVGKTGYLTAGSASLVGTVRTYSIDGHFYMRPFGQVFQLKHTFGLSSDGSSAYQHFYNIPLVIPALTDIKVSVISSATNGVVNSTFDIVLIDD